MRGASSPACLTRFVSALLHRPFAWFIEELHRVSISYPRCMVFCLFMQLDGSIVLVLDPDLEPALRLVVVDGVASLRAHRVETLLTLEEPTLPAGIAASCDSVLYISRPLPHLMRLVASQVRSLHKARASAAGGRGRGVQCHLALSPRRTFLAESLLREEGALGPAGDDSALGSLSSTSFSASGSGGRGGSSASGGVGGTSGAGSSSAASSSSSLLSVGEFSGFEVLPVDDDLLVMPAAEAALGDVALRGDTGPIRAVAGALAKLQAAYGPFGCIRAKGALSGAVVEQLLRQRREAEGAAAIAGGALSIDSALSVGGPGAAPGSAAGSSGGIGGAGAAGGAAGARSPGFNLAAAMADTRTHVRVLGGAGAAVAASTAAAGGAGSRSTAAGSAAASTAAGASGGVKAAGAAAAKGEIDTCILLDRSVDWVTPLLSSLTYESLLHESALGPLRCGMITLDSALVVDPADKDKDSTNAKPGDKAAAAAAALPPTVTLHVNSNLKMYADLRDCNIQKACPRLAGRAREIQALRDSVTKSKAADLAVADIRSFVKKIPGLQVSEQWTCMRACALAALRE